MADFLNAYSIQYWLESCPQGYLEDTEYGHAPGESEPDVVMSDPLLREQAEKFRGMLAEHVELGPLTDMICGYLPFEPEFKLQQMQTRNVIERAARTISQLERMGGFAPEKPLKLDDAPPAN